MFRSPSFNPSPNRRALWRNLALDLVAATGLGVTMALITALLPTIARRGGLEPLGLICALTSAIGVVMFARVGAIARRRMRDGHGVPAARVESIGSAAGAAGAAGTAGTAVG